MLKKITLILLSSNLLVSKPTSTDNPPKEGMSILEGAVCGAVGIGVVAVTVVFAPVVVPVIIVSAKGAATVVAAKTVVVGAAIKTGCIAVAPVAKTVSMAIVVGKAGKKLIYSSPEEKLQKALTKESSDFYQAKLDFEKCLNEHSLDKDKNSLNISSACEEVGMLFVMLAQERRSSK